VVNIVEHLSARFCTTFCSFLTVSSPFGSTYGDYIGVGRGLIPGNQGEYQRIRENKGENSASTPCIALGLEHSWYSWLFLVYSCKTAKTPSSLPPTNSFKPSHRAAWMSRFSLKPLFSSPLHCEIPVRKVRIRPDYRRSWAELARTVRIRNVPFSVRLKPETGISGIKPTLTRSRNNCPFPFPNSETGDVQHSRDPHVYPPDSPHSWLKPSGSSHTGTTHSSTIGWPEGEDYAQTGHPP